MTKDARTRYTEMVIQSSFASLLRHTPLEKITVSAICKSAEINRSTFYKHYDNPHDLLNRMEDELLSELQSLVSSDSGPVSATLAAVLDRIKTDGSLYVSLFSENGDSGFSARVVQLCYRDLSKDVSRRFAALSASQREWFYYFIAQGCNAVVNRWVVDGMHEPAEDVARFIEQAITGLSNPAQFLETDACAH